MKIIYLKNNKGITIVDDDDYERVKKHPWYLLGKRYAQSYIKVKPKTYIKIKMHRFILKLTTMDKVAVDHINHNGFDNRKENLRIATRQQNGANRGKVTTRKGKNTTSKYKGVCWHSGKWQAQIGNNGKGMYLGRYKKEKDAAAAYDKKAKELFGNFYCKLNK